MTPKEARDMGWKEPDATRFAEWFTQCNQAFMDMTGLSLLDMPDQNYSDAFYDGRDPIEYAMEIADEEGFPF